VYQASDRKTGGLVAVKIIRKFELSLKQVCSGILLGLPLLTVV
jgi:hypothetical protein